MSDKIRLGVLFGGRSCEHEVSVTSARSMLAALDLSRYEVTLIRIGKEGQWRVVHDPALLPGGAAGAEETAVLLDHGAGGALLPKRAVRSPREPGPLAAGARPSTRLDVVFPLLHGPFGEDGTVQGLLELAGLPYVGSGVLGSAVGMDKAMMKRAFRAEGLPVLDYLTIKRTRIESGLDAVRREAEERLGYPMFVKPASLGSSVGVHRIAHREGFADAVRDAVSFDEKVLLETAAPHPREIECAVLGNDAPQASVLGEIVPGNEFYDYAAKYVDDTSRLVIPAPLSDATAARVRGLALDAFRAIDASGLARVDFFVDARDETVYLNEINTMPGFTPISMYPKLWEASGLGYPELIDRLIELALERHAARGAIRTVL